MTEDQLQIICADYLRWKYPDLLFCHIPNGGSRNAIEGKKLKRMGVTPGMPDIFIPLANRKYEYLGFFCELKVKPNKPTKTQIEVLNKLTENGYFCCVCYDADQFMESVNKYLQTD